MRVPDTRLERIAAAPHLPALADRLADLDIQGAVPPLDKRADQQPRRNLPAGQLLTQLLGQARTTRWQKQQATIAIRTGFVATGQRGPAAALAVIDDIDPLGYRLVADLGACRSLEDALTHARETLESWPPPRNHCQ